MTSFLKYVFYNVFPFMKFTQKNLSCKKKIFAFFDTLVFLVVLSWLSAYLIFPLYAKAFNYGNYRIYVNDENITQTQVDSVLKSAIHTLKKNPIYHPENSAKIYVVNNPLLYAILSPFEVMDWWDTYAVATLGNLIVVKKGDFLTNKVYHQRSTENFDAVLAHELTHTLQFDRYGYISAQYTIPTWVMEGYATYSEQKLPTDPIEQLYKKSFFQLVKSGLHVSLQYQYWALMVKYAIETMHVSVDDLHRGRVDYDTVKASMNKH